MCAVVGGVCLREEGKIRRGCGWAVICECRRVRKVERDNRWTRHENEDIRTNRVREQREPSDYWEAPRPFVTTRCIGSHPEKSFDWFLIMLYTYHLLVITWRKPGDSFTCFPRKHLPSYLQLCDFKVARITRKMLLHRICRQNSLNISLTITVIKTKTIMSAEVTVLSSSIHLLCKVEYISLRVWRTRWGCQVILQRKDQ